MYLEKTLSENEKIEKIMPLHKICYVFPISCILFSILMLLIGIMLLMKYNTGQIFLFFATMIFIPSVIILIERLCIEMVVTDKRVIKKTGIISVNTDELKLEKVESVSIRKNLFGAIFNYGTIYLSGTGTTKIRFDFISSPIKIKKELENIMENYQKTLKNNL